MIMILVIISWCCSFNPLPNKLTQGQVTINAKNRLMNAALESEVYARHVVIADNECMQVSV